MAKEIKKKNVEKLIYDWINRLNSLYDTVEGWLPSNDMKIIRSAITQRIEEFMKEFDVKPKKIPVLTLLKEKKRLAFVPSALWVVGADGRVNITSNKKQYILVDMRSGQSKSSNWQLVVDDIRKSTIHFNKKTFINLLRENT